MKRESWLPATPESAHIARVQVREAARACGLDDVATWDLMLATSEAVANAVLHGVACDNGKKGIGLCIEQCTDGICVEVCDCGVFDAEPAWAREDATHGRGIPIIAAVVDHFELVPDACQTRVRFGKRRALAAV